MERRSRIREYCHVDHYHLYGPLGSEWTGIISFRSNSTYHRYIVAHEHLPSLLAGCGLDFQEAQPYLLGDTVITDCCPTNWLRCIIRTQDACHYAHYREGFRRGRAEVLLVL
jgi:hypothetical protein